MSPAQVGHYTCMLCDAHCGLRVQCEGGRVTDIRGDAADPFSRGHICPKGTAIGDLMEDPDRVRQPLKRTADGFVPVSWDAALDDIAARLAAIRQAGGPDAIATYMGNPTAHDHGAALASVVLRKALGGTNHYSALSIDTLPRMVASQVMYGVPTAVPIPDIDRSDLLVILGANPLVSNGSGMVSPDLRNRLADIQARGGRVVVLDPRRTETADKADAFHFIRPGSDALLLLAMIEHLCSHGFAAKSSVLQRFGSGGLDALTQAVATFTAEQVEDRTGVPASTVRALAEELASTPRGSLYGRMGTCVQEHGTSATILIDLVNALADNLDHEGGTRFGTPGVDLLRLASFLPKSEDLGAKRSRVDGLPSYLGEYPVAALPAEIETPGRGQIKAMLVHAGNPVSSNPNGTRLGEALDRLDLVVAVDIYVNETTRHAHYILPTPVAFERPQYPLFFGQQGVRNFAFFDAPLVRAPAEVRESWDILVDLAARTSGRLGGLRHLAAGVLRVIRRFGPERIIGLLLRLGPQPIRLKGLRAAGTTTDLGPLEARLQTILGWKKKRLDLFPVLLAEQLPALAQLRDSEPPELVLISRRTLSSNNSWLHNLGRLNRGRPRCTLEMNPVDAEERGLLDGAPVLLISEIGRIEVPLAVTDRVMPGVVCLPHGWGQKRDGVVLRVASEQVGASVNDVIDHRRVDPVSGTSALSGQPVTVEAGS